MYPDEGFTCHSIACHYSRYLETICEYKNIIVDRCQMTEHVDRRALEIIDIVVLGPR
jgi:hypothetical protein